jgi:hypothetical protein
MAGGARVIRQLREPDAESYVELRRQGLLAAPLAFGASPEDDMAASAEAVRDRLRQGPGWVILGAFQDGLVGAVGLMRDRAVKAKVLVLAVLPPFEGRGSTRRSCPWR